LAATSVVAGLLLAHIFHAHLDEVVRVLDCLELPHENGYVSLSEYELLRHLYERYESTDALIADVVARLRLEPGTIGRLYLDYSLYINRVIIRPEYRELLFGSG